MRDGDRQGPRRRPAPQPRQVRHGGVALSAHLPVAGPPSDALPGTVVGVGVDIVDTARFSRVIVRSPRLVPRVFTEQEIAQSGGSAPRAASLAARWAAKEAVAKVLVDNRGLSWHDCEVVTGDRGEPSLRLTGTVERAARERGIARWLLSLSHDGDMAIAFVVASSA